ISAEGGAALAIALDVTCEDSVAAAVAQAEVRLGPLTLLVNNAGVVVSKSVLEHTEEEWDYVVDTNLKGAWLMAREFARHLVERRRPGRIINIASVLGSRTIARVPSYCAAKAGLIHLTHVLAMELARHGILVNALAPGYVETDFNREFLKSGAGQKLAARIPLRRVAQADDLDGAMLLLASPAGAYITGAVIAVDGGHAVAAI
ncbi:MAG: SDR family NAD(P)-dependent oxidoreductase, partial [Stellaceae bacterium]